MIMTLHCHCLHAIAMCVDIFLKSSLKPQSLKAVLSVLISHRFVSLLL